LDDWLHPEYLATPVVYHSHFSATGWGSRSLTPDEVGIAFGLPAWARHADLKIAQSFPCVSVQVMDACLKPILGRVRSKQALQTPAPQDPAIWQAQTWIPTIQNFLPHSWIDADLVTEKAVKSDGAGVLSHL
jgi:hypothetical protein